MPRSPPGLLQLALTDPCTITVNNHYNTDIDKHKVGKISKVFMIDHTLLDCTSLVDF